MPSQVQVPPQDSPMLGFLYMTTQLTWFHICDGSRLMEAFLRGQHLGAARPAVAAPRVAGAAAGERVACTAAGVYQEAQLVQQQQQEALQASVAAAATAAAAEAEAAAATAVAQASQHAAPAVRAAVNAAAAAAAPAAGSAGALPAPQAAAPGAPARQPSPAVPAAPADSARSEGTAVGGLSRLASVPSSLSRMHSSGSSRSLGTTTPAAPGRFDPLGVAGARRKARQSGSS